MDKHAVMGLAREALVLHVEGDVPGAYAAVQRLSEEHGPEALGGAMIAWATTALNAAGADGDRSGLQSIAFRNIKTDEHTAADQTPPPVRWGGRFLMAVLVRDEDQLVALVDSTQDEQESTINVVTLLSMCSIAITHGIGRFDGDVDELLRSRR